MSEPMTCRACGGAALRLVLSFGMTPLADVLLTEAELDQPEQCYPLDLTFCEGCALVQLLESVDPEVLYGGEYPYYTSVAPGLVRHFEASARALLAAGRLGPSSLVVEAASNDGHMLRVFADAGVPVLGVDPARGPAAAAETAGVPTLVDYFGGRVAQRLVSEGRRADLVLGNNVLNLLDDPNDFAAALAVLLSDKGVAVLEVPYVVATVDQGAFDNVFHQNVTYFSLTAADRLFARHGLVVQDVERIPTFGGSLRLTVGRDDARSDSVREVLAEERARGVDTFGYYADFAARAEATRRELDALLRRHHEAGARIAAYGAAGGMATTLLSYAGIDHTLVDYAVDLNPHKHGSYTSGSHLRIHPAETLAEDRPDLVLLLAWNYEQEVLAQQDAYRRCGGRFVIPVPEPRIV